MFVRLSEFTEERLERLARRRGLRKCPYARQIILRLIEDQEDLYEAERILRRVKAGEESTHTLDEVARHLGLDH